MVSVTHKAATHRRATAQARIYLNAAAFELVVNPPRSDEAIKRGKPGKGDVLSVAQLAGIMATKQTSTLIPLCHPLPLTSVRVTLHPERETHSVLVRCTTECLGPTGVEMEAIMGANAAALVVWDMVKAVAGRDMRIGDVMVLEKSGGKSGDWERRGDRARKSGKDEKGES